MSRRQFGFLVGYVTARVLEGDLDLGELTDRFTGPSSTTRR